MLCGTHLLESYCKEPSITDTNRPFPGSCLPPLQSESKCEVFVMKISFHSYVK